MTNQTKVIEAGDILPNGYRVIETKPCSNMGGPTAVVVLAYLSNNGSRETSSAKYGVWYADRARPDSTTSGYYTPDLLAATAETNRRAGR